MGQIKKNFGFYKSLDSMPIWNWYKVHSDKGNGWKYLMRLEDYDVQVYVKPFLLLARWYQRLFVFPKLQSNYVIVSRHFKTLLNATYETLIADLQELDDSTFEAKKDIIVEILMLVSKIYEQSRDPEKIEKAGIVLSALTIDRDPNERWLFEVNFTETSEQKRLVSDIAISIDRYNKKKQAKENIPQQTLEDKKVAIETLLGVSIDIKKDSVKTWKAYEKAYFEKINSIRKQARNG